ncbi:MAG TPA: SIS domain-containing protein [Bdellovibrionota bacterium]|nr:SIS domain-containing protein [Bdellovibrionota bacterium]
MPDSERPDPRFKNRVFEGQSVSEYFGNYVTALQQSLAGISKPALERAMLILRHAIDSNQEIFVAGNGGSSAIAEHLICDFTKGTFVADHKRVRVTSLTSNVPLFTALANDCGYDVVFSKQLEFKARKGDVLMLVSSSGNSPNVIQAAQLARKLGMRTIGFTGFDGGKLAKLVDASVHVDISNYGVVEDAHHVLMHAFSQFIAKAHDQGRSDESVSPRSRGAGSA